MSILALIALIFTVWFVVLGLGLMLKNQHLCKRICNLAGEDELLWSWGFFTIALGAVIVGLTNYTIVWTGYVWVLPLIGWLGVLKGVWLLWWPWAVSDWIKKYCKPGGLSVLGGLVLVLLGVFFWQTIVPIY